mgnify:CR=1 FL=1
MKKILSIVLAVLMLVSCSSMAFAATINQDTAEPKKADVVVETTLNGSTMPATGTYEISIPADLDIVWGTTTATPADPAEIGSLNYSVTSQLALGAKLTVSVAASSDKLVCTTDDTVTLDYTSTGFSAQEFANAINDNATPDVAVTIAVPDWTNAPVTTYATTLTYTVVYTPAA